MTMTKARNKFEVGDVVVYLNSDVEMTVEDPGQSIDVDYYKTVGIEIPGRDNNLVTCVWFDKTDDFHRGTFKAELLLLMRRS